MCWLCSTFFFFFFFQNQVACEAFFASEKPEYVFLAAAKVGGIVANDTYPVDFLQENLLMQTNVVSLSHKLRRGSKLVWFHGS